MSDRAACLPLPSRWAVPLCCTIVGWALLGAAGEISESRMTPIVKAVQRARASVVNIKGEKTLARPDATHAASEASRRVNGMGTGVVIDPRGYILTNHHVVDGVREIQVRQADGKRYVANLIARDPETDLAIIKIDPPSDLPVIEMGKSSDLLPGETVVAVGNAYGYEHTVTQGIISALHRAVQVSDAQFYEDLIQTDASINPGNSGGPLLNIDGDMIGINVAVRAGAQGIGFAIPVDKAMSVASRLIAAHTLKKTWHGVTLSDEKPAEGSGLIVAAVDEKSPAAEAGLQSGDVITGVESDAVERGLDFHRAFLDRKAGDSLKLAVRRNDELKDLEITLGGRPASAAQSGPAWEVLGLDLKAIPEETFKRRFRTRYRGGLDVVSVRAGSPAAEQGLRAGDVLVGMHIWETITPENVTYILNRPDLSAINPVKFFILRGNETLYGYLPVAVNVAQASRN